MSIDTCETKSNSKAANNAYKYICTYIDIFVDIIVILCGHHSLYSQMFMECEVM